MMEHREEDWVDIGLLRHRTLSFMWGVFQRYPIEVAASPQWTRRPPC